MLGCRRPGLCAAGGGHGALVPRQSGRAGGAERGSGACGGAQGGM